MKARCKNNGGSVVTNVDPCKQKGPILRTVAIALMALTAVVMVSSGCASRQTTESEQSPAEFQAMISAQERVTEINENLMMMAVTSGQGQEYRVGSEDRIRIDVLGVPDLSREYRINGAGSVLMPLIGAVPVAGLKLSEVEQAVAEALAKDFIRNPDVSVEVTEFRSQQFTVVGAVSSPRVYNTSRQVSLIEALAMAGGVAENAGNLVFLNDRVPDPETGRPGTRTLVIDIQELMQSAEQFNLMLGENAMINVPRGGYVYVEGAVSRPGAVPQRTDTTVLIAIAQAGGLSQDASRGEIGILRRDPTSGRWESMVVNYSQIKDNPAQDIQLKSGDIVVVENSAIRSAWTQFLRIASPLALFGFRPLN